MEALWRLTHWLQGWRVCSSSWGARWLISTSAYSGFCHFIACPGVLLSHPWCDASPLQITSSIFQVALTLARTICNSSVEKQCSILPKTTAWPPWPGFDYRFIKPESTEWVTRLWHFMLWPQSVPQCFRGSWQQGLEPSIHDCPN